MLSPYTPPCSQLIMRSLPSHLVSLSPSHLWAKHDGIQTHQSELARLHHPNTFTLRHASCQSALHDEKAFPARHLLPHKHLSHISARTVPTSTGFNQSKWSPPSNPQARTSPSPTSPRSRIGHTQHIRALQSLSRLPRAAQMEAIRHRRRHCPHHSPRALTCVG